jgi:hypothetical protein
MLFLVDIFHSKIYICTELFKKIYIIVIRKQNHECEIVDCPNPSSSALQYVDTYIKRIYHTLRSR